MFIPLATARGSVTSGALPISSGFCGRLFAQSHSQDAFIVRVRQRAGPYDLDQNHTVIRSWRGSAACRGRATRAVSGRIFRADSSGSRWTVVPDRSVTQFNSRRPSSCIRYLRIFDVARVALDQTAARDDYDSRLSNQSLSLLNRISRRVSASRHPG